MENIIAKVIRIDLDIYILNVLDSDKIISSKVRGNVKKRQNILVGDIVQVEKTDSDYMIVDVHERKNSLIRPPVSNIDQMVIVVSVGNPVPDYTLLDKQIVLCLSKNIKPIICINKIDLKDQLNEVSQELAYIKSVYEKLDIKVVYVSAKENIGIEELRRELIGSTSAFSGNSGVGKSSIISLMTDEEKIEVGELGEKSKRGKHTTKSVNLYKIEKNTYILDTPGFSSYELYDVDHKELKNYYKEFLSCQCDYDDCAHVIEAASVCDVKRKVESKEIDLARYERYVYIYTKLKEKYDKRYK